MSSICPGLSIRGRSRPMSHLVDRQPVTAVADSLTAKPVVLALLRRIDGIRGDCGESIKDEPGMQELLSRQLVPFYSSYRRRRPEFRVHVLSKGDMVLDELDRRERRADVADTIVRLIEPDLDRAVAALDAAGPPPIRRSRIALR